jgi:hypothetical protein
MQPVDSLYAAGNGVMRNRLQGAVGFGLPLKEFDCHFPSAGHSV